MWFIFFLFSLKFKFKYLITLQLGKGSIGKLQEQFFYQMRFQFWGRMKEWGSQQHLLEAFIQIGLLSVTSRGWIFSRHSCSHCGLNCERVGGVQIVLVIVDVLSLILFQLFDHFSISECLRRARGRKYSRGWNKLQDNFCLLLVVEDQEAKTSFSFVSWPHFSIAHFLLHLCYVWGLACDHCITDEERIMMTFEAVASSVSAQNSWVGFWCSYVLDSVPNTGNLYRGDSLTDDEILRQKKHISAETNCMAFLHHCYC